MYWILLSDRNHYMGSAIQNGCSSNNYAMYEAYTRLVAKDGGIYIVLRVMPLPSIRWLNKSERKTEPFHKNIGGRHFDFWRWYMQSESINFTHQLTNWRIQIYMQSLHTNTHSRKWTFWVQWMSGTLKQSVSKSSLVVHVWYMGNSPEQKIIYSRAF